MKKFAIFAIGASIAAASFATAAFAGESDAALADTRSMIQVSVQYGDLDLSSRADAAVLMGRLQQAALQACGGSDFSVPDYRYAVRHSDCYRDSLDRAVHQIGAPTLSELNDNGQRALASN